MAKHSSNNQKTVYPENIDILLDDENHAIIRRRICLSDYGSVNRYISIELDISDPKTSHYYEMLKQVYKNIGEVIHRYCQKDKQNHLSAESKLDPKSALETAKNGLTQTLKEINTKKPKDITLKLQDYRKPSETKSIESLEAQCAYIQEAFTNIQKTIGNDYSEHQNKDKVIEFIETQIEAIKLLNTDSKNIFSSDMVGLAFSGGGIRSASFNLGVLQALKNRRILGNVDYLSTVSGGGYIGASYTYLNQKQRPSKNRMDKDECFPFNRDNKSSVTWIRRHASFLMPGQGLTIWPLIVAFARGVLLNLFMMLTMAYTLMVLLTSSSQKTTETVTYISSLFSKADPVTPGTIEYFLFATFCALLALAIMTTYRKQKERYDVYGQRYKKNIIFYVLETITWLISIVAIAFILRLIFKQETSLYDRYTPFFTIAAITGLMLFCKLIISNLLLALLAIKRLQMEFSGSRYFAIQYGDTLKLSVILLLIGSIPLLSTTIDMVENWIKTSGLIGNKVSCTNNSDCDLRTGIAGSFTSFGTIMAGLGWMYRTSKNETSGFVSFLLRVGLSLMILGGIILLFNLALLNIHTSISSSVYVAYGIGVVWLILILFTDINYLSLHRYYRNRLMEAFFCKPDSIKGHKLNDSNSDNIDMNKIDIGYSGAPYPIINTTIQTIGSSNEKLRLRGGDSFMFSPLYTGSAATGWLSTSSPIHKCENLATAAAISGASVDPNIGVTRSTSLSTLMILLNVRLGYWIRNPDSPKRGSFYNYLQHNWLTLINRELFASPDEKKQYVRLTDGGHFENLALYELARRKCKVIIVSDAGEDKNFTYSDLARACERIRVDFNADIEFKEDIISMTPDKNTGYRISPITHGSIRYSDGEVGMIFYINTSMFSGLPIDVAGYSRGNKDFPDESSADQFFSEEQFEAYRELGYQAGCQLISNKPKTQDLEKLTL